MNDLLEDRYRLLEKPGEHAGLLRARDELLEQDVDLVVLDPVGEPLERARMLRQLRRTLRSADPHVALVQDTGTSGDRPFLVLPAESSPEEHWTTAFVPAVAARIVLDVLDGVSGMRQAGLSWLSLRLEDLRVAGDGRAQVVPLPGPPDATEDDPEVLASLGLLLTELLPDMAEPMRVLAARATGLASPPLTTAEELRQLLGGYASSAPTPDEAPIPAAPAGIPPAAAQPAPPVPPTGEVPPARTAPPTVAASAVPSRGPVDTDVDPAYAPKMVRLSSLLAHELPGDDYVPLSSLMHDRDEGIDDAPPARPAPKGRGLFHRRSRDGDQIGSS